jgi:hypothetical protein
MCKFEALRRAFFMIQFGENIGWLLPLLLICAGGSALLYFFKPDGYSNKVRIGLAILRFAILCLIGLFLIDPLVKYSSTEEEKPSFIIGIDQSESILANRDSSEIKQLIQKVKDKIESIENVDLNVIGFGKEVVENFDFSEKGTNISAYLKFVDDNYSFRNVAGHVLLTDGIVNSGVDPDYVDLKTKNPMDIIALGDTAKRPDQMMLDTRYNKIVYLGNKFPIQVTVRANFLKGKSTSLSINSSSGENFSEDFEYKSQNEILKFNIEFEAKKAGVQLITIQLNEIEGESNVLNNKVVIPIEVLESKEQIALIYHTLSPDIGAIQKVISGNDNLEVDLVQSTELSIELINNLKNKYNGLILYQIPSSKLELNANLLKALYAIELPAMHIIGKYVNMSQFASLNTGVAIKGNVNGMVNTTIAGLNSNFSLFKIPKESATILNEYPPVAAPFGEYSFKGKNSTVLFQKMGNVQSEIPLWTFTEFNGKNAVFVMGEGFWKWPLAEYNKNGNTDLFTSLVESSISYLSVKKDKSRLRVYAVSNYSSSENIVLKAELYNELYEPINSPNIELKLKKNDSLNYEYSFDRSEIGYRLNMGTLEQGIYNYTAKTVVNGVEISKSGQFSVSEVNMELANLEANHKVLYKLSKKNGGQFYLPSEYDKWNSKLESQQFSSILYSQINFKDLIDFKWFFALVILLLGAEWLIRKREGFL